MALTALLSDFNFHSPSTIYFCIKGIYLVQLQIWLLQFLTQNCRHSGFPVLAITPPGATTAHVHELGEPSTPRFIVPLSLLPVFLKYLSSGESAHAQVAKVTGSLHIKFYEYSG